MDMIAALRGKLAEAENERADLQHTFDMQWKSNQRAIKRWQAAHPGNDLVWPDRTDMIVWLMNERDAARASEARMKETLRATIAEWREMGEEKITAENAAWVIASEIARAAPAPNTDEKGTG